jgi:hypothetical protein
MIILVWRVIDSLLFDPVIEPVEIPYALQPGRYRVVTYSFLDFTISSQFVAERVRAGSVLASADNLCRAGDRCAVTLA